MAMYGKLLGGLTLAVVTLIAACAASGQEEKASAEGTRAEAAAKEEHSHGHSKPTSGEKTSEKPDDDKKKPDDKEKPDDDKKKPDDKEKSDDDKKKPDEGPKPISRPTEPPQPPDPEELDVRPDETGKVKFSFSGQPWPDVLRWLADVSEMSLDWQELPGDFLNLTTRQSYTVEQTRDLINRHLLARGYTILRNGEVLSVVKTEGLDPGMVPRVASEELVGRSPHEFVKVSFSLDWLTAESAAEEFKPMLSPHGKLTALTTTNRLEAIDTVANLREIGRLLAEEQSDSGQDRLVREFELRYAKAEEVHEQLQALLGVQKKTTPARPMSSDEMRRVHEAQMRAQQEAQRSGKSASKPAAKSKTQAQAYLVVNRRRNSILVQAPPDKMAIISQAVKFLDVPSDSGKSLLANMSRMQIYRLAAIDPEPLVTTLDELGGLDPTTRLEADKKNKAIIAYATLADHVTIRALIDKLDGSSRKFEVIRLRRLAADYVAGSIEFMMGGKKEEKSSRRSPYDYYSYRYRSNQPEEPADKFRVDADVENNRLLLWVNEIELEEVRNLLVKLGEIPAEGGNPDTVRFIDTFSEEETQELLERVRRTWPSLAPNQLLLTPHEQKPDGEPESGKSPPPDSSPDETTTRTRRPVATFVQLRRPASGEEAQPAKPPPISITQGPDGRLVISSQDTRALDLLEELMAQLAPPRRDYEIFRLKHAWAYGLALTLEDVFKEDDKKDSGRYSYWSYFDYDYGRGDSDDEGARLSKRRPLKFISDSDTNSILVQNASPTQLEKIRKLVEFYDRSEPVDSQSVRKSEVIQIQYSRASAIAETIKEVYRDLLSENDKSLAKHTQDQRASSRYLYVYSSGSEDQKKPRFKGLLSIGIDDLSNTLIISAPVFLLDDVAAMAKKLDAAAEPASPAVCVFKVGTGVTAERVQEALAKALGEGGSMGRSRSRSSSGRPPEHRSSGSSSSSSRSRSSSSR